jgi:hypothetical protein
MAADGNPFVAQLNRYTTVSSDHEAAFDEYIQEAEDESPLVLETATQAFVQALFDKGRSASVILTGNAGDGKTHLCRQIVSTFQKAPLRKWEDDLVFDVKHGEATLRVVKDLSEVDEVRGREVIESLEADLDRDDIAYLIAANEGRLRSLLSAPGVPRVKEAVEQQLRGGEAHEGTLYVINLNRAATSTYVPAVLRWVAQLEHWEACAGCPARERCPIRFNAAQLRERRTAERLGRLYEVVEQLGEHVTIRDMLIHLAYTVTAGLSCRDVIDGGAKAVPHVYYRNVWGERASETFREKAAVLHALAPVDPAASSIFRLDAAVVNRRPEHLSGAAFGERLDLGGKTFEQERSAYLSGYEHARGDEATFLAWLPAVRRKLFFELEEEAAALDMLPFLYAHDYFELLGGRREPDDYQHQVLLGLNRALTGLFLDDASHLYVTAQYVHSAEQPVPIVRLKLPAANVELSVEVVEEDGTAPVDRAPAQLLLHIFPPPQLMMRLMKEGKDVRPVVRPVDLLLFEYLLRRANGATPEQLAKQCSLTVRHLRDDLLTAFASSGSGEVEFFTARHNRFQLKTVDPDRKDGIHIS